MNNIANVNEDMKQFDEKLDNIKEDIQKYDNLIKIFYKSIF